MGFDDLCNTGLILGLGFSPPSSKRSPPQKLRRISDGPSLTLSLSGDHDHRIAVAVDGLFRQDSGGSSFSSSLKREREEPINVEIPEQRGEEDGNNDEDEDDGSNSRKKKLRLSRAQSALLEESFMLHTTLNPKQKQELARQLKLRPRQVEVWFQNRRARTKLKQTEVDCEFLKKCCEALTDENQRLQKELKALKLGQPLRMQLPAAALTMCPSCERVVGGAAGSSPESVAFVMAPKPHFFNPFTSSSAA